ncbi:MAG: alpha/beta hydrolase, partial [Pseudomonadota bacterium]
LEVARLLEEYEPTEAKKRFEQSHTASQLKREAPDNLASLLGFFGRTPQNETQALLAAIASDGPGVSLNEIESLNIRTLVIGTAHDFIHPLEMAHELADLIPKAQFVEITSKTSNPMQYQAEIQSALRHFLQEME